MRDLFNRVLASEQSKNNWRKDYDSLQWKEASKANEYLFGKPLNRAKKCECIEDLFIILKHRNLNEVIMKEESRKFFLKPDKVIMVNGCDPVTSKSSDEKLIELLKLYPGHIKNFERYPDNWEKIVGLPLKVKETKAKEVKEWGSDNTYPEAARNIPPSKVKEETQENDNSKRTDELFLMKNADLKKLLTTDELPEKINKENLVAAILQKEA